MKLLASWLLLLILCCAHVDATPWDKSKLAYIIHADKPSMPPNFDHHLQWYDSSLKAVSDSAEMLYVYDHAIHGFSATLTATEAASLESQPGILSVMADVRYELHTTRTPEFLGLPQAEALLPDAKAASDVIIGVIDTGVWPELHSFDDKLLGPTRASWKGTCQTGRNFSSSSCNRKLVGARFFSMGYEAAVGPIDERTESKSPRDDDGHGTHTITTAGGSAVAGAELFGFAPGIARGMATSARVAAYKVCWEGGCFGSDILGAMDAAIQDGVDVLSLSIGGGASDLYRDIISIGAFSAMAHGIFVSCSAGNSGPTPVSVSNVAPWITTVGAGTLDREFPADVRLGDGSNFTGTALYSGKPLTRSSYRLVFAGNVSKMADGNLCKTGGLDSEQVKGKIVVCDRGETARVQKSEVVKQAGGVGMILANTQTYGDELVADAHLLPAAAVGQRSGDAIKRYIFSNADATATIVSRGTVLGVQPSPVVAAFSSRGPSSVVPGILKPDMIAPGVNILAGWSLNAAPTGLSTDSRRVRFNIISGTSMSCPHVSGVAALVKAAHPEWSPAAIRSALMTTAYTNYKNGSPLQDVATGKPATPFDYGAGHVNPVAALDPGLIYDATVDDYLAFLCALNYTAEEIARATKTNFTCDATKTYAVGDLNYPSFAVLLETASDRDAARVTTSKQSQTRTLTNVGPPATYKVSVASETSSVKITVQPEELTFSQAYEKKSYTVTFTAASKPSGTIGFAKLTWSDQKHQVTSPIAFSWT